MRIKRGCQIERACGPWFRGQKYRFDCAFVKRECAAADGRSVLAATDGRMLVAVIVTLEDGEVDGLIPTDAIIMARSNDAHLLSLSHGVVIQKGGDIIAQFTRPVGEFPSFDKVGILPSRPTDRRPINVNARYLGNIGAAIGSPILRMFPGDTADSAIRVEMHGIDSLAGDVDALCAVMPITEDPL